MRDWMPRLTSGLVWIGIALIVVGLTMWWRETRQAVALFSPEQVAVVANAPRILPSFDEAEVPATGPLPVSTQAPTFTPQASPTAAVAATQTNTAAPPSATPIPPPTTSATPPPTATPAGPPVASKPPTRIVAPAIGLDAKVVPMGWETRYDAKGQAYSEWVVPSFAAGWHLNSALPGQVGNVVLSGHHNIEGEVFRYVVNLNPGDQISLYVDDQLYQYTVAERMILPEKGQPYEVRLKNAQYIAQTPDARLTLVTCWPYTTNTHRVVVVAQPVEPPQPIANN